MNKKSTQNNDWSQTLGQKLQESEIQPSPQLWDRIERSRAPKIAPRGNATKWWAAAAAALLIVGVAALEMLDSAVDSTVQEMVIADNFVSTSEQTPAVEPTTEMVNPIIAEAKPTAVRTTPSQPKITKTVSEDIAPIEPEATIEVAQKEPQEAEITDKPADNTPQTNPKPREKYNYETAKIAKPQSAAGKLIALNLSSGFNGTASPSSVASQPSMLAMELLSANGYMTVETTDYYNGGEISHRAPLNLEISAALSLSERLSLVSGLNYTSLTSDIASPYSEVEQMTQRVQFVGIPLALHYNIVSLNDLVLYGGVGGNLERMVSAKLDGEKFDEKPWHTSLSATLGVEYRITNLIGIYAEPELTKYFTETNLTTIRSESPLNFNVKFGIRFAM